MNIETENCKACWECEAVFPLFTGLELCPNCDCELIEGFDWDK